MQFSIFTLSGVLTSVVRFTVGAPFVAALAVSQASAQSADNSGPTAASEQLQEVVVTAQFRRQDLQQTPIAITAVNAAMLEQRNQTDISQVASQAPNVTLQPNGAAFGSSMVAFIRGVGQTDFNLALEPGVGIYVDDVYYATLTGSVLDLLDLDRVEILRGPQGTLAGKNSIGGAIKLFSQKPTGNGTTYLEAGYGSLNRIDARGAADFTLSPDKLFVRLSFASKHHDGYVTRVDYACTHPGSNIPTHSVGDGCTLGKDGSQAFDAARIALRWLPTEAVEVNLAADATNDQSGVQANTVIKFDPVSPTPTNPNSPTLGALTYITGVNGAPVTYGRQFIPYGPQSTDPNHPNNPYLSYATYTSNAKSFVFGPDPYAPITVPPINHFKAWGVSSDIRWTLADKLSLTSITAYRDYTNQFAEQTDASPIGVEILLQRQKHLQFSQELRLNGSVGSAVDYTVGGFYLRQDGGLNARVGLPWVGFDFIHGPDSTPSRTEAAFANAEWHVTDKLNLVGGVRYSNEKKTYTYYRHNGDGSDITDPAGYNGLVAGLNGTSATFQGTRTDYRLDLDYQITSDVMAYVETSTGYKGGGVNPRPFYPSQALNFQPETLKAYEVGLKTNLFERRMRLNLAAFYNIYNNIQLTLASCPTPPLNGIQYPPAPCALPSNVGSAHVEGLEVETELHPLGGLEIDASASYLNFKYTKINDVVDSGITLGMTTPYTPKYKASVGAQYEIPIGDKGSVTPRVDMSYQSSQFANPINDPAWNQIDGYTILNGRLTWRDKADVWQASLNVTNMTNKLYYLTLFDLHSSTGYVNGQPAMPREWSLMFKRNFRAL
ncbi:MAG: TonB-dependent receptor-like protein [Gammaproteobacteria bacterium]|nr:TonB-dependent receptor-like protein [Gammaproteobacteria bacterium]